MREWCRNYLWAACLAACITAAGAASAGTQSLLKQSVLPLDAARRAVLAAVRTCGKQGYKVSAAVVDPSGVLTALMRADGAGPHTVESSRRKAYTAASLRRPTRVMAQLIAEHPALQGLRDMNESILMLGGGLPIRIGGQIVGGIGVGGSPGADLDEGCARAGLERIGADPYRQAK